MKNLTISTLVICLYICLSACSSSDKDLTPTLSHDAVELVVGESAVVSVTNASNISVSSVSSIISIAVTDHQIAITALKEGETNIRVNADGVRLQCVVTVVGNGGNSTDNPEPDNDSYSYDEELYDAVSRYVSADMVLRYDHPGIVFARENNRFMALNLDTDDIVCFTCDGDVVVGALTNPHLTVNDVAIDISEASVEQINEVGIWFHILATTGEHIVFVVADI